jgi:hypothetical protein
MLISLNISVYWSDLRDKVSSCQVEFLASLLFVTHCVLLCGNVDVCGEFFVQKRKINSIKGKS